MHYAEQIAPSIWVDSYSESASVDQTAEAVTAY